MEIKTTKRIMLSEKNLTKKWVALDDVEKLITEAEINNKSVLKTWCYFKKKLKEASED